MNLVRDDMAFTRQFVDALAPTNFALRLDAKKKTPATA